MQPVPISLYKLLPLLQIQQPYHHPDDPSYQKENTILYNQSFPDHREEVIGHFKRIQQDIPKRAFYEIHITGNQQNNSQDDRQHSRTVPTMRYSGDDKSQVSEENKLKHQLGR